MEVSVQSILGRHRLLECIDVFPRFEFKALPRLQLNPFQNSRVDLVNVSPDDDCGISLRSSNCEWRIERIFYCGQSALSTKARKCGLRHAMSVQALAYYTLLCHHERFRYGKVIVTCDYFSGAAPIRTEKSPCAP